MSESITVTDARDSSGVIEKKDKVFFPNLDGLRFFAFFSVFLAHSFGTDYQYIKDEAWYRIFKIRMFSDGDLGVSFFFVLSGFLITYLLLKEKELTGKVHVGSFYVRRVLRIWPLYYLTVFLGFIIFPLFKTYFGETPHETADPVLCSVFLNNFNAIINGPPDSSILTVLWSVAIEEQFYLVWPLLFLFVPSRYYARIFIIIIIASVISRIDVFQLSKDMNTLCVISDMAIGGLCAYLAMHKKNFMSRFTGMSFGVSLIPYMMTLVFIVFKQEIFAQPAMLVLKRVVITFFFAWIIMDQNFGRHPYLKVGRLKLISRLGKYTYGLYCLHSLAILVVMTLLKKYSLNTSSWHLLLLNGPLALSLSILISYLSYHLYEKHFLRLKNRFAFITK